MDRPKPEELKARALAIVEETMAYPESARERLLDIKRGAIQQIVDGFEKNVELVEKHYPGYQKEDLQALIHLLPKGKSKEWHL
jgi:hypothetical protein